MFLLHDGLPMIYTFLPLSATNYYGELSISEYIFTPYGRASVARQPNQVGTDYLETKEETHVECLQSF